MLLLLINVYHVKFYHINWSYPTVVDTTMESIYTDVAIQSQLSKCTAETVSSDAAIPKAIKKRQKNLILLDSVHDDD